MRERPVRSLIFLTVQNLTFKDFFTNFAYKMA